MESLGSPTPTFSDLLNPRMFSICFLSPLIFGRKLDDSFCQEPDLAEREAFLQAVDEYNSYGIALHNPKWQIDECAAQGLVLGFQWFQVSRHSQCALLGGCQQTCVDHD